MDGGQGMAQLTDLQRRVRLGRMTVCCILQGRPAALWWPETDETQHLLTHRHRHTQTHAQTHHVTHSIHASVCMYIAMHPSYLPCCFGDGVATAGFLSPPTAGTGVCVCADSASLSLWTTRPPPSSTISIVSNGPTHNTTQHSPCRCRCTCVSGLAWCCRLPPCHPACHPSYVTYHSAAPPVCRLSCLCLPR